MNEKEPEKKEQKFLHFSDRIARHGVESDDVGEICVGVGNYLDDARTALIRYYDDAMNRAKFEKNAKATVDSLVKARNIIGLAIGMLEKLGQEQDEEESEVAEVVKNDQVASEDSRGLVSEELAKEILEKVSSDVNDYPFSTLPWTSIVKNLLYETFKRVKPYPDATETFEENLRYCARKKGTNNWRGTDESPRREDGILTKEEAKAILDQRVTQILWCDKSEYGPCLPYFAPYDNDEPVPWEDFVGVVVWEASKIVEISDNDIRDTVLWAKRYSYVCDWDKCKRCVVSATYGAICPEALKGSHDAWCYGLAVHQEITRPKIVKELVKHFCVVPTRETIDSAVRYCKVFYFPVKDAPCAKRFARSEILRGEEAAALAGECKNSLRVRPDQKHQIEDVVLNAIKHVYVGRNITEEEWNEILTELVSDE